MIDLRHALAPSRDLGMSHKACWVLLHKVREAMAEEFKGRKLGGTGKSLKRTAHIWGLCAPSQFQREPP
jgi:hypothetical protein